MTQLPLNLVESRRLKREGMTLSASKNSDWMRDRLEDLRQFILIYPEFCTETFRAWCALNKKPQPSSPNAWGAFTNWAAGQGVVIWTGRYMQASSKKTHAHVVKVWRAM